MLIRIFVFITALAGLAYALGARADAVPAAYQLMQSDVETAVAKELVAKGAAARVHAQLLGEKSPVIMQGEKPLSPHISGLSFDKNTSRWTANLLIMSGSEVLTAMPVSGHYDEVVRRPVLKRQVRNGEIIAGSDIDTMDFPIYLTRSDEITDVSQLIGQSPRAVISPHRPIRPSELAHPALVHKNDIVTMHYTDGAMDISTSGQIVSEGAKGDMVEVRNLTSKTVVRGMVEDANTVSVNPAPMPTRLAGVPYAPAN